MSKLKVICNYLTTCLIKGVLETNTSSCNSLKTYGPHNVGKKSIALPSKHWAKKEVSIRNFISKEMLNGKLHVLCSKINCLVSIKQQQ